jgi:hypothetical protein
MMVCLHACLGVSRFAVLFVCVVLGGGVAFFSLFSIIGYIPPLLLEWIPLPSCMHIYPSTFLYHSLETVMYLNLRVGRESLNHTVLSNDLSVHERGGPYGGGVSSRRGMAGMGIGGTTAMDADYRQVPLVESTAGSYAAPIGADHMMMMDHHQHPIIVTGGSNDSMGVGGASAGVDDLQLHEVSPEQYSSSHTGGAPVGMQDIA